MPAAGAKTTQAATEMGALAQIYVSLRRWTDAEYWAKASLAAQGNKLLQNDRPVLVLMRVAEQRGDYREALRREHQARLINEARAGRESQRLVQQERARFETDRAEQQVALLTARTQQQATNAEVIRLRYRQQVAGIGALGGLVLVLAGGLLWRYRRRQAQRAARREEELRVRLAADLHDDVGTLLSQIAMQSDVLQAGLADPAGQRQQLGQISEASRTAMRQLNDVVWEPRCPQTTTCTTCSTACATSPTTCCRPPALP